MAVSSIDLSQYQDNKLLVDWLTFTCFADYEPMEFFKRFIPDNIDVFDVDRGMYGYKKTIFCGHIRLYYDGADNMGMCFDMSGQGCREFEDWGNMDIMALLHYIYTNEHCFLTRIDIAYDDFTGSLDIKEICHDCIENNVVCKWRSGICNIGFLSNQGLNIQFGSSSSEIVLRIYDKAAERDLLDDVHHWIRAELQLRSERAEDFLYHLFNDETIESMYFGILRNYLRFVIPNINETNKSRWSTQSYWIDFLGTYDGKRLFRQPGVEYNLSKLDRNVTVMYANSIYAYLQIHGMKQFLSNINIKGDKLPPKYVGLIQAYKHTKEIINAIGEVKKEDVLLS